MNDAKKITVFACPNCRKEYRTAEEAVLCHFFALKLYIKFVMSVPSVENFMKGLTTRKLVVNRRKANDQD